MKSSKSNKPTDNQPKPPPGPAASKPVAPKPAPDDDDSIADAAVDAEIEAAVNAAAAADAAAAASAAAASAALKPAAPKSRSPRARVRKPATITPEFSFATELPNALATASTHAPSRIPTALMPDAPAPVPAKPRPMTIATLIATPVDLATTATAIPNGAAAPTVNRKLETVNSSAPAAPIVMMTRIRLARNLSAHRFPGFADESRRAAALATARAALAAAPALHPAYDLTIDALTDLEKQILVERHLISRELAAQKHNAAVMISQDQTCSIMLNEEDHLRIQFLRAGFQLKKTWAAINAFDTALEDTLEYAFSPALGYLTACPTNLGTGLRASAMMHLPALGMCGLMEKVVRAVNQLGIVVRGQFGEGSDATGSIYQISNQTTLGETEEQIIRRLSAVLNSVVEAEQNSRARLLEKDAPRLHDKIGRAYGILRHSRLLSTGEAMNLLSLIRLGADLGNFPPAARATVDRLFIEAQPGHIQYATQKTELDPAHRDTARATLIRDALAAIPAPDFTNTHATN